jgi:Ankyrin repeat
VSGQTPLGGGRSGGAAWLLALLAAFVVTLGVVVVLGYRSLRSALTERQKSAPAAQTAQQAAPETVPPAPQAAPATPAAAPAPVASAEPVRQRETPRATPAAAAPSAAPAQRGLRQPRYGPEDARSKPQDAYRAALDAMRRGDAGALTKYELGAVLAQQTAEAEVLREIGSPVPFEAARVARTKQRGDRAVLVANVVSRAVTNDKGESAPIQVVARMAREGGHWKIARQTWLIATPLEEHEREALAWLDEKPAGAGQSSGPRRRLEALGASYDAEHFQFAVAKADVEQVRLFLQAGMSPATKMADGQRSLFALALLGLGASQAHEDVVLAMVASGRAPLEEKTPTGLTAVSQAVLGCKPKVVEALLQAGANPNAKDNDGRTPLKWAHQMCRGVEKPLRAAGGR